MDRVLGKQSRDRSGMVSWGSLAEWPEINQHVAWKEGSGMGIYTCPNSTHLFFGLTAHQTLCSCRQQAELGVVQRGELS